MAAPTIDLVGWWGGKLRAQDFTVRSGDDLDIRVTVFNLDRTRKDLTGATVKWVLTDGVNVHASKDTTAGVVLTTPAEGIMTISLAGTDSAAIEGDFPHEAEVTDASGAKATVMVGTAVVPKDLIA